MKRIYIFLITTMLIVQACSTIKRTTQKKQLTTQPEKPALVVNQSADPFFIPVDYTLNVPKNYVMPCARLVYEPYFTATDNKYGLTPVVITGTKYGRLENRLEELEGKAPEFPQAKHYAAEKKDMQINISEKVPFQAWMPESKLMATITLKACNHDTILYTQTVNNKVEYVPIPAPVVKKFVQKEVVQKEDGFARFYYPANGFKVDPALDNNQNQLDDMRSLVNKIKHDTTMHITRIVITGICSPDGAYSYNESLARKRAEYIQQYLIDQNQITPNIVEARYIPEDWTELRKLISESDLQNKDAALKIIDEVVNEDQREAALRKLPQFNYIKQNFYPLLRKVTYEIYYTTTKWVETKTTE